MIRHVHPRKHARRGAILLVVLGMLALFAVVGLSFVLYAESEATGARNNRTARNELSDPDPASAANGFLSQLIFGSVDNSSSLFSHDLARSRFAAVTFLNQTPFNGNGIPSEALTLNGLTNTGTPTAPLNLDRTSVVNFRFANGWSVVNPDAMLNNTPINKAVPWTYPDRHNLYLAYYDPVTDQVTVPSFFRPDLFASGGNIALALSPANPKWRNNNDPAGGDSTGYYQILRPRQGEHPQFPTVPANADGTYTGDVANLKFLTGNQRNDSLWMDVGLPVKQWRGKSYKPLIAPLILDLGGRLNLTVAGNNKNQSGTHGSQQGWGTWEMNPAPVTMPLAFLQPGSTNPGGPGDLQNLLALRLTGSTLATPTNIPMTGLNKFTLGSVGNLNGGMTGSGQMPPQYMLLNASGQNTNTPASDAMTLPQAGLFSPFPVYPTTTFAPNLAQLTTQLAPAGGSIAHGQTFSPYQWPRQTSLNTTTPTPYVPSMEDQLRLMLPFGGPKGQSVLASQNITPNRKTTTHFSVSQRWGEVVVNQNGTPAKLAAIDLTRPLPDYRLQGAAGYAPLSPANMGNAPAAQLARQTLAFDIFVRLLAVLQWPANVNGPTPATPIIDGTNVVYNPTTATLTISYPAAVGITTPYGFLRSVAQYAVNMVDQIDVDDISTPFLWNPAVATDYVFGTELPKLVLSEAYCMLNNSRRDSTAAPNTGPPMVPPANNQPNRDNLLKRYWLELQNPLSPDPTLPDGGAARLRYDPATTKVPDVNNMPVAPPYAASVSVYQIEIAEVAPAAMAGTPTQPYTSYLATAPQAIAANNVANPIPGATLKIVLNDYTPYNPQPMGGAAAATDATNIVVPTSGTGLPVTPQPNGYFIIGPQDLFPSNPQVPNNLCVADPPAMPMGPVNSLSYDTGTQKPTGNMAPTSDPTTTTSVILLRRLANPYMAPQIDPTMPNYNPYVTVDYLENVPTRDRAQFDTTGDRTKNMWTASVGASIGRKHPFAASPCYNPTQAGMGAMPFPAVLDQAPAMAINNNPPHTFGAPNSPLDNNRGMGALGLEWLVHLDREPVNIFELLSTSAASPALLTQQFYDGGVYQKHINFNPTIQPGQSAYPLLLDALTPPVGMTTGPLYTTAYKALDLLSVSSRLPGVPLGGREPGRVNMNAAMDALAAGDAAMLQAVLDPQSGNSFNAAFVTGAWGTPATGLLAGRTTQTAPYASTVPGSNNWPSATRYESTGAAPGNDRPFVPPLGSASVDDTFLRSANPGMTPLLPLLLNSATAPPHLYLQSEPLRKGWNNMTTVSDGFLVVFTVGFFEVSPIGAPAGSLGKELFDKVPGDLRAQYAGIVDRSALTIDPAPNPPLPAGQFALGAKPWETKLVADAPIGQTFIVMQGQLTSPTSATVFSDGAQITIPTLAMPAADQGTLLRIGYSDIALGGDGEWVRAVSVSAGPVAGTVTIGLNTIPTAGAMPPATPPPVYSTALQRFHGGSSRVSNAVLGNPGPQPLFDFRDPANTGKYNGVLPFFMRMLP